MMDVARLELDIEEIDEREADLSEGVMLGLSKVADFAVEPIVQAHNKSTSRKKYVFIPRIPNAAGARINSVRPNQKPQDPCI
jgi:hypothetical protein